MTCVLVSATVTHARCVDIGHRGFRESHAVWFRVDDGRQTGCAFVRSVDENDDDDAICCKRFCTQHHDFHDDETCAWMSGDGTSGDGDARGVVELWVSGVFPARGGGTHGTGGG